MHQNTIPDLSVPSCRVFKLPLLYCSLFVLDVQLVFHAGPDTAQIDSVHLVKGFCRFIGEVTRWTSDTGIVERHI